MRRKELIRVKLPNEKDSEELILKSLNNLLNVL